MKTLYAILIILLLLFALSNCDSSTSPENDPPASNPPFTDLKVGQEWQYIKWEKLPSGSRTFTGDTISVSITAKKNNIVTFFECPVHSDSISPLDTATFRFQITDSRLMQVGRNYSRAFGFVANHNGILTLTNVDSNAITVDMDTTLFLIQQQTNKSRFIGHSESIQLFLETYQDVNIYYDATPTYVDGFGHLVIFSPKEGIVATIYFGGFSLIEQYGYQLIKR